MRRALLTACLLAVSTMAGAQEPNGQPYIGTWAPEVDLCKGGNFHWVFGATEAHNEAFSCQTATYEFLEPGHWDVHMTHCHDDQSHFATDERISVQDDVLEWKGKTFHRCLFDRN